LHRRQTPPKTALQQARENAEAAKISGINEGKYLQILIVNIFVQLVLQMTNK
jgi:hypothetical protein